MGWGVGLEVKVWDIFFFFFFFFFLRITLYFYYPAIENKLKRGLNTNTLGFNMMFNVHFFIIIMMIIGVTVIEKGPIANGDVKMETKFMQLEDKDGNIGKVIFFFFFFRFSLTSLSRYETGQSVGGAKTGEPREKPPDTPASRTWLVSIGKV